MADAVFEQPRLAGIYDADMRGSLVTFRWTFVFKRDGRVLTSDSTLRFRDREEVVDSLRSAGFSVDEVRDAPDRPGRELVFIAKR